MAHQTCRRTRWRVSGFVLFGLAICSLLPFGALGAIDASFTSSMVVPHHRPTTQHPGRQAADRPPPGSTAHQTPPIRAERASVQAPVLRRLLAPFDPLVLGLLAAVVVVFALAGSASPRLASLPSLARPPSRGPPVVC